MQIIKKLSKFIGEELDDSEKYVRCALTHKDDNPTLAEMFYSLSLEEMKHMEMLHKAVVKAIEEVKQTREDEIPIGMMETYNYIHEQHIEHAKEIRMLQTMFRE